MHFQIPWLFMTFHDRMNPASGPQDVEHPPAWRWSNFKVPRVSRKWNILLPDVGATSRSLGSPGSGTSSLLTFEQLQDSWDSQGVEHPPAWRWSNFKIPRVPRVWNILPPDVGTTLRSLGSPCQDVEYHPTCRQDYFRIPRVPRVWNILRLLSGILQVL